MRSLKDGMRAVMAAALCVLIVEQPLLAGAVVHRGPTAGGPQLLGNARVLHALNRLTFGPRPGDVAAVKAMGLNAWFEMQLNPAKIDDSALEARLAQFPAMRLAQQDLIARYPTQQMLKQLERTNTWLPADLTERAIYGDELEFYRQQQAKQAMAAVAAPDAMAANGGQDTGMAGKKAARPAGAGPGTAGATAQGGEMAGGMAGGDMAASAQMDAMLTDAAKPAPEGDALPKSA